MAYNTLNEYQRRTAARHLITLRRYRDEFRLAINPDANITIANKHLAHLYNEKAKSYREALKVATD